ncbi:hypothetical protein T484DRAFT_2162013 [Baffinella frigidus]|nr:hypothetical protein T484DRAFT_2162013 [Cryptophyta sp. CCMP2293]
MARFFALFAVRPRPCPPATPPRPPLACSVMPSHSALSARSLNLDPSILFPCNRSPPCLSTFNPHPALRRFSALPLVGPGRAPRLPGPFLQELADAPLAKPFQRNRSCWPPPPHSPSPPSSSTPRYPPRRRTPRPETGNI